MRKIGLTGSIGSGKSTVSRIFSSIGVKIYYADNEAKKFLAYKEIKDQLIDTFGKDILGANHEIDRKKLGKRVFSNQQELLFLNSLIHPLVRSDFESWLRQFMDEEYIIHEAAIIYETGFNENFDAIISVSAPEDMRITRVMERDTVNREDVIRRMENQWSDEHKVGMADYVIVNDEQNLLIPQVLHIHSQLTVGSRP